MSSSLVRRLARASYQARAFRPASLPLVATRLASDKPSQFQSPPSPPRLPEEQQAEFERLQRAANTQQPESADASGQSEADERTLGEGNLPLRKGAPPEFEGEVNPKTGEVGGPKNEPLRWGSGSDWSFNGRVTDF